MIAETRTDCGAAPSSQRSGALFKRTSESLQTLFKRAPREPRILYSVGRLLAVSTDRREYTMRKFIVGIVGALALIGFGTAAEKSSAKGQDTYTGIMTSMRINKDGTVSEIYIKLSGNVRTERIKGCGMRNADHPTLNQFFMNKHLVYITQVNGCFNNVEVKP